MAYAAVTCLYHTLHILLTSPRTSLTSSTQKLLRSARRTTKRLQTTLQKYDHIKNNSQQVMDVEARIRDEACRLEDLIESHASPQFLSQSQAHGRFSLDLHPLRHDINCFIATIKKMATEYMQELHKPSSPHQEEPLLDASSTNGGNMVGLSDLFLKIRDEMIDEEWGSALKVLLVTGMAGVGKTALAQKLFNDPLVKKSYECWAFVRVGQKSQFEEVLRAVIPQVNVNSSHHIMKEDESMGDYLTRSLEGRKFFIVFDDQWDHDFGHNLYALMPYNGYVLITCRHNDGYAGYQWRMRLMNEEESWELLQRKVFNEQGDNCPPHLVKPGKKIAENCEGLPLLILTIAQHLSLQADKDLDYWNQVAEMKNSVFDDACDQIYDRLVSSFHFLTQKPKACFLYMGLFPRKYVIRRSRIINLWCAERLANEQDWDLLDYIVSSSLAVVHQHTFLSDSVRSWTKDFSLHLVYRHVSRREGENNKFMCILDKYDDDDDSIFQRIEENRRLAIYHNTLLAIKEVHSYINSASNLHSVLCTGPYHQYQVPICSEPKLLRVLDALTIRFYEFPSELVKLIQLRYLSLTTNANLPSSINKLWFLEYLIVHQHWRINKSVAKSYVPVEIWELKELKHLQIVGRNLPHPPPGSTLPNLINLLDVGVQSCDKAVVESIPMLEKLRIQIESGPDVDATQTITCFEHISCLNYLRSLGTAIMNPKLMHKSIASPRLRLSANNLRRLSLSGIGYSWEDMDVIAEMQFLQVLKLQCFAFRGEKWEAKEFQYFSFNCLLIEDTDLVKWTAGAEAFQGLRTLRIQNCPKLQEIPLFRSVEKIEMVDCNPAVETFVKKFKPEQLQLNYQLRVDYSWE